jgi:alpha-ketoglutarate-dependent taurine dioxygenase
MLPETVRPAIVRVADYRHIRVQPLSGSIGARIDGVNLAAVTPNQMTEIKRAFADHLVIYFRDQVNFSREDHLRFAREFGEIQPIPHIEGRRDYPEIQLVHRDADDHRGIVGEAFHSDSTFMTTPPTAVVMRAIQTPPYGGDTAFANLYLAYETLSETLREFLDGLSVVHSAKKLFGSGVDQKRYAMKAMNADVGDREVVHPLVLTHPQTGRKSIFVNPVYCLRIEGMTEAESTPILDFLYRHATFIPFTARVRWEEETVLVWDNWAAYHSAVGDYQGYARTLERVTLGGRVPA